MKEKDIRDVILDTLIVSSEAQLRALKRLRTKGVEKSRRRRGRSKTYLVEDILRREGGPLHITEIIEKVQQQHGVSLDRESIVSQLSKKVVRKQQFVRVAPNTFDLLAEAREEEQ